MFMFPLCLSPTHFFLPFFVSSFSLLGLASCHVMHTNKFYWQKNFPIFASVFFFHIILAQPKKHLELHEFIRRVAKSENGRNCNMSHTIVGGEETSINSFECRFTFRFHRLFGLCIVPDWQWKSSIGFV